MPKYIVTRPWHGVKKGQTIDLDPTKVNKAFLSNVVPAVDHSSAASLPDDQVLGNEDLNDLGGDEGGDQAFDWETVRHEVIAELDDSDIEYEADAPASELAAMLPHEIAEGIKLGAE